MAVHQGLLRRRLELWLGGAWVDFSDRLLTQTLSPNPGRTSGGNQVSPSTIAFSLDNPLGDLTPFRAESTYFPGIDVGMLVRYSAYWDGNWHVRGVFEATEVVPHWPYGDLSDGTTTGQPGESYVAISASDILQRLSDNQQPLLSALDRAVLADGPSQFWPMTDGSDSTRPASALPSGVAMQLHSGTLDFAAAEGPAGAPGPMLDMSAGALTVAFPTVGGTGYTIELIAKLTTAADPSDLMFRMRFAGSINTISEDCDFIPNDGQWHHYLLAESQVGADVYRERWLDGVLDFDFTFAGTTVLHPNGLNMNVEPPFFGPVQIGYVAIHPHAAVDAAARYQAMRGWAGETAGRRVERLAAEQGISFTSTGDLDETSPMGPQPTSTLYAAFRECEDADLGIFHAQREANGVHYRTRGSLYNQTPALVLDASQGEIANPFRPAATAKHTVNDVTVSRPDGSSATAINQDSIDRVNRRPRSYDVNTETDEQLPGMAGWLLNLGTPDGMHYPSVSSELTVATQLVEDWLPLSLGDRIQVINLPPQHPSDTVDLLVDGYTEPHSPSRWTPQINCSPAAPWTVAELDDDDLGRLDTDGAVLTTAYNPSATSLVVASTVAGSPLWTTDGGEMPVPIIVSGEVMSVTSITSVAYDAFSRTVANGWGTADSGHAWTTGGGAAADFSVTTAGSGTGNIAMPTSMTERHVTLNVSTARHGAEAVLTTNTLPVGGVLRYGCSVRYVDTSNYIYGIAEIATTGYITAVIRKRVAGVITDVASTTTPLNIGTGNVMCRVRADDTTVTLWLWYQGGPMPMFPTISGTVNDAALQTGTRVGVFCRREGSAPTTVEWDDFAAVNPQTFTVTRSVNGVVKSQSASTAVNVYRPARLAL